MGRVGAFWVCAALYLGCGGDDGRDAVDSAIDAAATDAGANDARAGGAISASTNTVGCYCDSGRDVSTCDTSMTMTVYGGGNQRLEGVTATVNGQPLSWLGANYTGVTKGLENSYTFVAELGDDALTETHAAPSIFDVAVEPASPKVDMPLTVTWDVSGEANVIVEVGVDGPGNYYAENEADDGTLTVPASALQNAGTYQLVVRRYAYYEGEVFGAKTAIDLTRRAEFTLE